MDFDPLSDVESDISKTKPDNGLSSIRKYSGKDSPDDVWALPSGNLLTK